MKTLILTVGLPRSGKTTWSRKQGFPIVNPDSIRLALHGERFLPSAEPMVWTIARYMVQALFLAGHEMVILDATNTTKKRREEWYSKTWAVKYAMFQTSKAECLRRCAAGEPTDEFVTRLARMDLVPVIERMAAQFEPLEGAELAASFIV